MFFMPKTRSKPEPESEWFGGGPPNRPRRLQCTRSVERRDRYNVAYHPGPPPFKSAVTSSYVSVFPPILEEA